MVDLLHSAAASNWTNSVAPTSATLSNTTVDTANGYDKLDGRFGFAAKAGAVTDWILFCEQVPAGRSLKIYGVTINTANTGATVATTATLLDWSLVVDSTAVSLVTAGARRIGLGMQSFAIGVTAGISANQVSVKFSSPIIVKEGLYAHTIVRLPVGTATGSQVLAGTVAFDAEYI